MAIDTRPAFQALEGQTPKELFAQLPTPCYVIDEKKLQQNGEILTSIIKNTGCKILLAQKAFSNYDFYPVLSEYLSGTEASGLYEARLGAEEMPDKEVHVFCAAYSEDEFEELLQYADHIVFNSPNQLRKFGRKAKERGKSIGLRINPECSTQEGHEIYDPCAVGSRLGTTRKMWNEKMNGELISLLDGLHFHTLCEQDADALEITLQAVEEKFGDVLPNMKWLNMGGGHHITRPDYDITTLEKCIRYARDKWNLDVYLEPGEAVALNAGYLVSRVLDVVQNGDICIAILDASAACHMPDVIEMPYTPPIYKALEYCIQDAGSQARSEYKNESQVYSEYKNSSQSCSETKNESQACSENQSDKQECREHKLDKQECSNYKSNTGKYMEDKHIYRLAGPTCLAGDVIGDYMFEEELQEGDILLLGDMAIYTTCKNNTFNGMPLPDIWKRSGDGKLMRLTYFSYTDFKIRLGSRERSGDAKSVLRSAFYQK